MSDLSLFFLGWRYWLEMENLNKLRVEFGLRKNSKEKKGFLEAAEIQYWERDFQKGRLSSVWSAFMTNRQFCRQEREQEALLQRSSALELAKVEHADKLIQKINGGILTMFVHEVLREWRVEVVHEQYEKKLSGTAAEALQDKMVGLAYNIVTISDDRAWKLSFQLIFTQFRLQASLQQAASAKQAAKQAVSTMGEAM